MTKVKSVSDIPKKEFLIDKILSNSPSSIIPPVFTSESKIVVLIESTLSRRRASKLEIWSRISSASWVHKEHPEQREQISCSSYFLLLAFCWDKYGRNNSYKSKIRIFLGLFLFFKLVNLVRDEWELSSTSFRHSKQIESGMIWSPWNTIINHFKFKKQICKIYNQV